MDYLQMAIAGDQKAFEILINSVKTRLYKTGMAILKNDDDVCDAIQETLLSAYKNLNALQNQEYFTTWITRILINKCYDIIKKGQKLSYLNDKIEANFETDSYYDNYKEESVVEVVLEKIDPELKLITVLYYYDEISVKEIAQMLNIPEGTVKSRLSRARDKIYAILKEEEVK